MIINKNKLVAARENSLMNQFELSVESKVDLNFIRQLELNGGNVSKAIAEKLAIARLNWSRELLKYGTDGKEKKND